MPSNLHVGSGEGNETTNSGKQLKNLYVGKSIDELNTQAKVKLIIKNGRIAYQQ